MRPKTLRDSFSHAMAGLVHVLRTQRHVRYQFIIAAGVLLLSVALPVTKVELLLLFFAIGLVLMAELVNSALEVAIDLSTDTYHPMARVAKDVAGGAVLVACGIAALIGGIIFLDMPRLKQLLTPGARVEPNVLHLLMVGVAVLAIVVVLGKLRVEKGTVGRGGIISAHTALAFLLFGSIYFLSHDPLISLLALLLALLVGQSRIDAGIHNVREVALGAIIALLLVAVLIQLRG